MFDNAIGIEKLWQIENMHNCEWWIVSDLTAGLDMEKGISVPMPEIKWVDPQYHDFDAQLVTTMNYRNFVVHHKSISSAQIALQ